jgi:hypothetical protein
MIIMLDIPDYNVNNGLEYHWEDGFEISVTESQSNIIIRANKAGLTSLAIQLLTLAQGAVPAGHHFHFDQHGGLEDGSKKELVIEKIDTTFNS